MRLNKDTYFDTLEDKLKFAKNKISTVCFLIMLFDSG